MEITIDLNDSKIDSLVHALDWPTDKKNELARAWGLLASEAWLSWASADKRYNSLTEQYTDWIGQIYERLFQDTGVPSAVQLFNSFNLPFGQVQYIARVLTNRAEARWRGRALEELKEKLRDKKDEVYGWEEEKEETSEVKIGLSKLAARELEIIIDKLDRQSLGVDPMRSYGRPFYMVTISPRTFRRVCEHLEVCEKVAT